MATHSQLPAASDASSIRRGGGGGGGVALPDSRVPAVRVQNLEQVLGRSGIWGSLHLDHAVQDDYVRSWSERASG
jgi:hypothetical protein